MKKQKFLKAIALIVMVFIFAITANTQTLIPFSGSNSVACGTNTTLCTHAGCGVAYSNNANGYTVLNAKVTSTITISGTYATESGYDYVRIYSGIGTGGTVVWGPYSGTGTINYTGAAGTSLTVQFSSDGSVTYTGLNATVTYSGICGRSNFNSNYPSGTSSTTSNSWQIITPIQWAGEFSYYQVEQGAVYEWTTCQTDGSCILGGTCLYINDLNLWNQDGTSLLKSGTACGSQSKINWTATFDGTVRMLMSGAGCSNNTISTTTLWRLASCPSPLGGTSTPTSSILYLNDANSTTVSLTSQYGTISYWERKDPGSSTWTNIGNAGATSFNTGALLSGTYKFRAAIVKCGVTAYSTESSVQVINNLPIQLIEFEGLCKDNTNEINWSTASELNNQNIKVEKSSNCEKWEHLTTLIGNGNSNTTKKYSIVDNDPYEITYYRLIQTDYNGAFEIFGPIVVSCGKDIVEKNVIIYPNPFNSIISINLFNVTDEKVLINVYNINGQLMEKSSYHISDTFINMINLDLDYLPAGQYFVEVRTNNYIKTSKIIKNE
jgi:hypothetical protein